MITREAHRPATDTRRGHALAVALIVAVLVAASSAGILALSSKYTRRQVNAVHDQRAFYLAEAGLSEAYHALTIGQTGQIGSMEQPAVSGDGLLWVDATASDDGTVRLESTALAGLGRASLALVVERVEEPLGIFADEDLVIDAPILVDGYDSEEAPYEEQVQGRGVVEVPKSMASPDDDDYAPEEGVILDFMGVEFRAVGENEENYFLELYDPDDSDMGSALKMLQELYNGNAPLDELPVDWDAFSFTIEDFQWNTTPTESGWATTDPAAGGTSTTTQDLGAHTSGGGKVASNGSITLAGPGTEVYGDVVHGPEGVVRLGSGTHVTGITVSRPKAIELPLVRVPPVPMQPSVEYGGAAPMIIPPSTIGYEGLTVLADAEVVLRGPSTVVIGAFELRDRSLLMVENLDGPVDLYVTQSASLALGSAIDVRSQDPSQLTLRVVGAADPITLASTSLFRGMVYGPEAAISVEAPFEVFGVLVGRTLDLGAGVRLHFDSGIAGDSGRLSLPKLVSWDVSEVPPEIRSHRMDPFEALQLDREELVPPTEAYETLSWTIKVVYQSESQQKEVTYEGPLESFQPWDVESRVSTERRSPDVAFAEPWRVWARHRSPSGPTEWEGTVADYRPRTMGKLIERIYTPPPELVAKGYEPSYHITPEP